MAAILAAVGVGVINVAMTLVALRLLGRGGAFWLYGVVGVPTLVFCWKLVPETKGKRLEDIFQARVDRRKARA